MNTEIDKNDFYEERQSFIKWAIRNHYDVSETTSVHGVLFKRQSTTDAWLGWLYSSRSNAEKLKDCVVVPKDQIEIWWQDTEEPENFATQLKDLHLIANHIEDGDFMAIDEHHTIHLPSTKLFGAWSYKDGKRIFITGTKDEVVEVARGGNHE
ncbi:hypothetical protein AWW72_17990 [Acinetobacter sp. NRRL B-65365]|uniref:hypothetical protein n=1 Tax=Acinetobacter sp. NRRL B-65365 TaxID=1785092 RepID=UPI0007A01FEF|nr:hypothetical protein [Acinetobacter sp. NRRL B-65365]KYQ82497.1 hypothetical protein AWW72_17990 [Acinetobacter sp. NRRL B-65365]